MTQVVAQTRGNSMGSTQKQTTRFPADASLYTIFAPKTFLVIQQPSPAPIQAQFCR